MPAANEVSERFGRVLSSVCSIQTSGNPLGTGFLVGPDAVLTNYHVVEHVIDEAGTPKNPVTCVFDYLKRPDGSVQLGTPFEVDKCLESSRYGPSETTANINDPVPTEEFLDYALLRLKQPVGQMQPAGQVVRRRGWVDLWDTPWDSQPPPAEGAKVLSNGSRVIVIQHPLGAPQLYAARNYLSENALNTRMRYQYMTAPGSSGSPCLTEEYKVFALHHLGDSSWNAIASSQGVPIKLIRARIARNNEGSIPKYDVLADATQLAPWSGLFGILAQYPDAKAALRRSSTTIKTITERTGDLRRHKAIHDVLQILQSNLPLLEAAFGDTDQKRANQTMRLTSITMRESWRTYSTEANELKTAARARGLSEMDWIDEFSNALTTLVESEQIIDKMRARSTIAKHLRYRPPELNGKIRLILRDLPVDDLLNVFQTILTSMDLKGIAAIVSSGPDLLRALWERLRKNVEDHNSWQDIDNELSMLEEQPLHDGSDPRWFRVGWEIAWPKTQPLCLASPGEDWSVELQRYAQAINGFIANDQWDSVADRFPMFRSSMTNRFSQVDKSLLSGSEQIIQLGNPLSALLEASL
jgi:hypothetical protein